MICIKKITVSGLEMRNCEGYRRHLQNKHGGKALCVYFVHFTALSVGFPHPFRGNTRGDIWISNQGSFR